MIFFIFRDIYKNQWIWTLLKTSISIISEKTYKTNVFSSFSSSPLAFFLLLLSISRDGYAYAVRYAVRVRNTRTQYGTIQPSTSFFNLAIHFLL